MLKLKSKGLARWIWNVLEKGMCTKAWKRENALFIENNKELCYDSVTECSLKVKCYIFMFIKRRKYSYIYNYIHLLGLVISAVCLKTPLSLVNAFVFVFQRCSWPPMPER